MIHTLTLLYCRTVYFTVVVLKRTGPGSCVDVRVCIPSGALWSQVRELDTFAGSMAAKKKACLDQIDKDRQELAYIDIQINSETRK